MAKRPAKPQAPPPLSNEPITTTNYPIGSTQKAPSMTSFSDILNTPVDQVEAPKVTPIGSYLCLIDGPHETGESSQKKTPYVRFNLKIMQAMDDVDHEAFTEAKALGRKLQATFYLTEDSIFRLKDFLVQAVGLTPSTFPQMLSEAPGQQVIATVQHELSQPTDGSEPRVRTRVERFAKV